MRKPAQERGLSHFVDLAGKPNSVVDDHLSGSFVASGLKRHFPPKRDTALHAGKDLFVALPAFDGTLPEGSPFAFAQGVSVGTSILADDGRYPLPIFHSPIGERKHVRTFLPYETCARTGDCLAWSARTIPRYNSVD